MKQTTVLFISMFLGVGLLAGCAGLEVVEAPPTETIQIMPMEVPWHIPKGFHGCEPMDYQNCWYVL